MKKIGKYEIISELGKGAMGVVYKALDPLIGREVAIKVISETMLEVPEIKERFYREARSVGKLSHENITVIYDVGEDEGRPFIVMEYLSGTDLRSFINRKTPLSLAQRLDYARQICLGLQYAHSKNIIHRDIKPENIKIMDDGKVKIMDFGIAKLLSSELTQTGTQIGTPWYMSPEQIRGAPLDQRADIFSFGIVFYELLVYRRPFEGEATTVMYKILNEPPEPVVLEENGVVDDLQALLAKCLEKAPNDRYPDFAGILKILDRIGKQARQQDSVKALLDEGRALMDRQLFKDAIVKFDEVLRLNPNHAEAQKLKQNSIEQEKYFQTLKIMMGEMAGETVSHYRISERIGAGGMGIVYKAEDTKLRRVVALKFLPPELTSDEQAKKRFVREAQAASALDHPNICAVHEIDETEAGQLFICMAYCDGMTLRKMITDFKMEIADSLNIVVQIAQGLVAAHAQGIFHRDIKPANLIVAKDGVVKIVDFGLAKLASGTRITKTGVSMGTLAYMSPEQVKNIEIDQRTDIWALGVILYEMLTGQLPFQRDYELALLYAIPHQPHVPAAEINPAVTRELEEIIDKALQKQAADRYPSMPEMLRALKQVRRQLGGPDTNFTKMEKKKSDKTMIPLGDADSEIVTLLEKGKYYLEQKRYGEALSRFRAVLEVDPNSQPAREMLTECERQQKEQQQIARLLSAAKNYFDRGEYQNASQAYREALALNSDLPEAKEALEKIDGLLEQSEKVEKLLSDAEFYLKKEKFERAVEIFQEALRLDPDNKPAARGLQRAEKGLENRRRETDRKRGTDRRKEMATIIEEKKPLAQSLRRSLAAGGILAVIVVVGWYLLSNSKSDNRVASSITAGEKAADPAASAPKQALAPLKAQAEQASAEIWATAAYENAARLEQRGDRELEAGNLTAAYQNYTAAADSYQVAIAAAEIAKTAAKNDLTQLKDRVANAQREMQKAKTAAEKAGGKTQAAALFARALKSEQEADQNAIAASVENLVAAQQAYVEARKLYTQAKTQVELVARTRDEAESVRLDMDKARANLPGRSEDWSSNANFLNAEKTAAAGLRQLQSGDYGAARDSFQQAKGLYLEAAGELRTKTLSSQANEAQASMQKARALVDKENYNEAKFRDAERIKDKAENFYNEGNFTDAVEKYREAETLYVAVAAAVKENLTRDSKKTAAVEQAVREVIEKYKASLERKDYAGFKALFKNFSKEDDKRWSGFFKNTKDVKVDLEIKSITPGGNTAKVDLISDMKFYNTASNRQDDPPPASLSWILEQVNEAWVIAKYQ